MNDIVCRDKRMDIHGKVSLEYVAKDGTTRQVCSGNAAFNAAWNSSFTIASFLRYSEGVLALTDYAGVVDKKLPIIPGNVVGCARVSAGTSGLYQGAEITASREQVIADSGKITDKRVYEFTSSQVPGPVRTIGYTLQWNSSRADTNYYGAGYKLPPMDPRKVYKNTSSSAGIDIEGEYRSVLNINQVTYNSSAHTFKAMLKKYAADGTYASYDLTVQYSALSSVSIYQYILVYDLDHVVYEIVADVFHYVGGERPYAVTRFFFTVDAALTTMTLTKTLLLTTGTSSDARSTDYYKHYIYPYNYNMYITSYGFKNGGKYYLHARENNSLADRKGLYEADLEAAHSDEVTQRALVRYIHPQIPFGGDDATTTVSTSSTQCALLIKDKIIAYTNSYSPYSICMYNLAELTVPYGTAYNKQAGRYNNYAFLIADHSDDSELLALYKSSYSGQTLFNDYWFESCGALTWFRVPDDAPERQEGDGIRITYEMTFTPLEGQ